MTIDDEVFWLKLAAHSKLNFKVSSHVRRVFMTPKFPRSHIMAYYSKEPNEDDIDLMTDVASELRGEFVELSECEVTYKFSDKPFEELDHLEYQLFARAEECPADQECPQHS